MNTQYNFTQKQEDDIKLIMLMASRGKILGS